MKMKPGDSSGPPRALEGGALGLPEVRRSCKAKAGQDRLSKRPWGPVGTSRTAEQALRGQGGPRRSPREGSQPRRAKGAQGEPGRTVSGWSGGPTGCQAAG